MVPESEFSPGALPDPPELVLAPGQRLGRCHLIRRLAVGGMAEIFLARVEGLEGFEKLVVLKSILRQRADDEDWVRMFLEEARLAATLQHPNIVQVFDVGREQNVNYFTMEYVEGADLRQVMKAAEDRGDGVPLEIALAVVVGAAAGLHHAHEKTDAEGRPADIVHRDVSPANVLVSFDGAVKIVDFGIAKAAARRAGTRTGTIKGKAGWISPEQCRGDRVDRRSDIFAIGILLYRLTTGVAPYTGENEYAILRQIVEQDPVPPSAHKPDYPPALEAIVMRALRRDPDERYATAQEMHIDLETFARDQGLTISAVELARFMDSLLGATRNRTADTNRPPTTASMRVHQAVPRGRQSWLVPAAASVLAIAFAGLWATGSLPFRRRSEAAVRMPIEVPVAASPGSLSAAPPPTPAPMPPAPAAAPDLSWLPVQQAVFTSRPTAQLAPAGARKKHARHDAKAAVRPRPAVKHTDPDAPFPR